MVKSGLTKTIHAVGKPYILAACLIFSLMVSAQGTLPITQVLDSLVAQQNYQEAKIKLDGHIKKLRSEQAYTQLTDLIYHIGKINLALYDQPTATLTLTHFLEALYKSRPSEKTLRQAQLNLAKYYEAIGNKQKAYEANISALKHTTLWPEATPEDYGLIETNLASLASQKGDLAQGVKHSLKAIKYYESYPKANKRNLYIAYNSMGASMWYTSKIDSALYYYSEAEKTLKQLEPTAINLYYRPAFIQNNRAAIYRSQNNTDAALNAMKLTIVYLNQFIRLESSGPKITDAKEFLFQAIENYGGIYKDVGNLGKAQELLEYSYKAKQQYFGMEHPELFKSKILLGQIYLAQKDYSLAQTYLEDGIAHLKRINQESSYWEADALYALAQLNEELGFTDTAKTFYAKAETLYEAILDGSYDALYLEFTLKASRFYARHNAPDKALSMAKRAYRYITENQGTTTSFEIGQTLNLGEIYYELGDYKQALNQSIATEKLLEKKLPAQTNPLDSTKIRIYKPQIILLKNRAAYKLQTNKSTAFLKKAFSELQEAIQLVEQQKTLIDEDTNIAILIDNNASIFQFAKQLALVLYEKTKDKHYLVAVLSLHESILYNRIRARLNSRSSMTYSNIPQEVIDQETFLKQKLKTSLNADNAIEAFMEAQSDWKNYLTKLKAAYPKYYKLRFASISRPLTDLQQNIPENTTLIKYLYSGEELYASVISKHDLQLFKLDTTQLHSRIATLINTNLTVEANLETLNALYQSLWHPFSGHITTKQVVIIPDADLFNLNFEMLSTQKLTNYNEMATKSLLSKHVISYNYSLFLIDSKFPTTNYNANFVAFVPEFNDQMKANYKAVITDSLHLDMTYLNLLPQPFTTDLAQKSTRLFRGVSYLKEQSTKSRFKSHALNHKIIHIGTHAESNNVSPELSRLIFAKSMDTTLINDNYLYTYEIYNTDLSSNLTILTACETGKPTYQAGEGMISLAHAFNYAGSESILTSLWKIDEQSSAKIVDLFYKNLKKGMPKDHALQRAKLDYIATAEGRTVAPEYWAGLVLIGDTSPMIWPIATQNMVLRTLLIIALIAGAIYFLKKKRSQ